MNKAEYNKIMMYLEQNKIDELKKYLDERMNSRYYNNIRRAIMDLISSDCTIDNPSYYQRTELHQGPIKVYNGLFTKTDNSFILCHKLSNAFLLHDFSILTPDIEKSFGRPYSKDEESNVKKLQKIFSSIDKRFKLPVYSTNVEEKFLRAWSLDGDEDAIVPNEYCVMATRLLGDNASMFTDKNGSGVFFESPTGKALILSRRQ